MKKMIMKIADLRHYLTATGADQKALFDRANRVRRKAIGSKVYFRGIIEFSNICEKNCYYCGIRKGNRGVERYRMSLKEIQLCLDFIKKAGYGSVVLQSGEMTTFFAKQFLLELVRLVRQCYPELRITLSLGELDYGTLERLRNAGAHRYLLRVETSVPSLYRKLHPKSHSLEKRIECLFHLKELGYQVGCGNMIGLPGQTLDDMIADLLFFKEMDFDMFGLGPYVIHHGTPLATPANRRWWHANRKRIFNTTLNFIALLRIMMPTCNIAAATALDVFDPHGRIKGLMAGANVVMPSVTPRKYRDKYLLYDNKPCVDGDADFCCSCMIRKVELAKLAPALNERGDSLHYLKRIHGQT